MSSFNRAMRIRKFAAKLTIIAVTLVSSQVEAFVNCRTSPSSSSTAKDSPTSKNNINVLRFNTLFEKLSDTSISEVISIKDEGINDKNILDLVGDEDGSSISNGFRSYGEVDEVLMQNDREAQNQKSQFLSIPSSVIWRGAVVGLCALWASNFATAKLVMGEPGVDSALYALSRFSLAAIALVPGSIIAIKRGDINWETARSAAICGGWVAFGYLGQTLGLLTTTASKSCVICSLHCVFVAAVSEAMRVSRSIAKNKETSFDLNRLIPALVAVLGVGIIELQGAGGAPTIGDALSFAQPIGFGLGYLQLENIMRENPQAGLPVSAIKLAVVSIMSLLFFEISPMLLHGQPYTGLVLPDFTPILQSPIALKGIAYTGLITTALALWVESIAFKQVPATDASIILTTEPLFAALAGALLLGETFGMSDYFGAAMIISACVLAVVIDDEASDDQCLVEDAMDGLCEPPRTVPISAE